jgi:hypothetical protein
VVELFAVQSKVMLALTLILFVCKAVAFVDAVSRPQEVFVASGKQTKPFWLLILGLTLAGHMLLWPAPLHLLNLIGTVAAFVYLADVRPTVKSLTRG